MRLRLHGTAIRRWVRRIYLAFATGTGGYFGNRLRGQFLRARLLDNSVLTLPSLKATPGANLGHWECHGLGTSDRGALPVSRIYRKNMTLAVKPRLSLEGQHFQVVVIGGGINGVAVARECARAGKRTLLVEQNDFASGVTSRSTRIIHGGLRYLEHGEIDLVRESVRERERLLRERSHLVHPVHFLFLLNEQSRRSAMKVRAGLWLYQRIAGRKSTDLSEMELKRVERALDALQFHLAQI